MHEVVIELSYVDCVLVSCWCRLPCRGYSSLVVGCLLLTVFTPHGVYSSRCLLLTVFTPHGVYSSRILLSSALCLDRSNTMLCSTVYPIAY